MNAQTRMRGLTLTVETELVTETCCNCGMLFAMPKDFQARALKQRGPQGIVFHCPSGHRQWYTGETEEARLRRENDRLKQNEAYLEDRRREAREEAEHQRRRANGYKGQAARIRNRVKAGVCPCCNRTFENLQRHMSTKHPSFTPEPAEEGVEA